MAPKKNIRKKPAARRAACKPRRPARNPYELFDRNTQAFIYNNQVNATQRMLDFDYVCGRETPSVAAIINPTGSDSLAKFFLGTREILLPVYKSLPRAAKKHPNVDVMINFASFRSAAASTGSWSSTHPSTTTSSRWSSPPARPWSPWGC